VGGVANDQRRNLQGRLRVSGVDMCQRYVFSIRGSVICSFSHCSSFSLSYIIHSSFVRFYAFVLFISKSAPDFSLRWWATAAIYTLCHRFLMKSLLFFSAFVLIGAICFDIESHKNIPLSPIHHVVLEHLTSFLPSIPQIHSNDIVLTRSLYLLMIRRFDSSSKYMRICYHYNTDIVRCFYTHQTSTSPISIVRPRPSPIPIFYKLFQCPNSDSVISVV
jgi:hypothetical protein